MNARELILLVWVDLSYTEIILTQFSVNLDSRVWKLYKNAFHVSLSLDKTCIWLGMGGFYHKSSHFFPTTLLTGSTWLMLFSRRYQFYMKPCAASSPPSLLDEGTSGVTVWKKYMQKFCIRKLILVSVSWHLFWKLLLPYVWNALVSSGILKPLSAQGRVYMKCLCAKCENSIYAAVSCAWCYSFWRDPYQVSFQI